MTKFVSLFKYSPEGYRHLLKEKATYREEALRHAFSSVGGKLDAVYWMDSGDYTAIVIGESSEEGASIAFHATDAASGIVAEQRIYRVFTSEETDKALSGFARPRRDTEA